MYRACERLDPRAVYGRSFNELKISEQLQFLGYDKLRYAEEAPRE